MKPCQKGDGAESGLCSRVLGNREHWKEGEHCSRGESSLEREGVLLGRQGPQTPGLWYCCWEMMLTGYVVQRLAAY